MINKLYLTAGAVAVSFAAGFWLNGNIWQSKWSARDAAEAQSIAAAHADELRRINAVNAKLNEAKEHAKKLQDEHASTVAASADAADKLRSEIARIKALRNKPDSSIVSISASAATDRLVLAELLEQSDKRATDYARQADENRIAVVNCNNEYNALRAVINGK